MFNFVISMFQYFNPFYWRKSEQNTVRINSLPDVIVAAYIGASLQCVKHPVVDNLIRLHGLGAIGRGPCFRETYTNGSVLNFYVSIQEMAVRSMAGTIVQSTARVTTRERRR